MAFVLEDVVQSIDATRRDIDIGSSTHKTSWMFASAQVTLPITGARNGICIKILDAETGSSSAPRSGTRVGEETEADVITSEFSC